MRGSAPLLVAIGSAPLHRRGAQPMAWAGILGITVGVALVKAWRTGSTLHHGKGWPLPSPTAIIAFYLVDGQGVSPEVRLGDDAMRYVLLLCSLLDGLPLPRCWCGGAAASSALCNAALCARERAGRVRCRWANHALRSAVMPSRCGAMTRAYVASIAALRAKPQPVFAAVLSAPGCCASASTSGMLGAGSSSRGDGLAPGLRTISRLP